MADVEQRDDLVREGQQRQHLGDKAPLPRKKPPPVLHLVAEEDVIDAAFQIVRCDRERVQGFGPAREEFAHPCLPRSRVGDVTPSALDRAQVGAEAVDDRCEGRPLEGGDLGEGGGAGGGLGCGGSRSQRGGDKYPNGKCH